MSVATEVSDLRARRFHLEAQLDAGADTARGTLAQARNALDAVEAALEGAEARARAGPEFAYLFQRRRTQRALAELPTPRYAEQANDPDAGGDMTKQEKLGEHLLELKKAEKALGMTNWALEGAGAKKNPPSKERAVALRARKAELVVQVTELRSKRDELKQVKAAA